MQSPAQMSGAFLFLPPTPPLFKTGLRGVYPLLSPPLEGLGVGWSLIVSTAISEIHNFRPKTRGTS